MKILKLIIVVLFFTSCNVGSTKMLSIYQKAYPKGTVYVTYTKDVIVIDSLNNVWFILPFKSNGSISSIVKIK